MTIRFLQLADSDVEGMPFMAGQTVEIAAPTPAMQRALQRGLAVVERQQEPETAIVETPERAVTRRSSRKRGLA